MRRLTPRRAYVAVGLTLGASLAIVAAIDATEGRAGGIRYDGPAAYAPSGIASCASDDGTGGPCLWDAQQQGNGQGRSFMVDGAGMLHYLDGKTPSACDAAEKAAGS